MSRETGIVKRLDSPEECKKTLLEIERDLPGGYMVWFAEAHGPDGKRFVIHEGNPYREE